ncbi:MULTISPECIES: hypothetical protein [unclassified Francisella]|uniref:hypothetical protein n=1 Tax=unclassified Francisella TaxID=2610885 RepID=UPI002E2F4B68|nr:MULTISPECIES: hypothetical protein [unclassified Francisella]MED7819362.1 hypothetical protein [Francisella sp. 19S2-4]MED7830181.1 hypothetical protein [Francisella sp. 19S2-10]
MKKLAITISFMLSITLGYSNNHFGNNLKACGMTFEPINLENTANWKNKGFKNNAQSKLIPTKNSIQFRTTNKEYTIAPITKNIAESLPPIGKWMIVNTKGYNEKDLPKNIAAAWVYWRGEKNFIINGVSQPQDYTVEPINTIFILNGFTNAQQANNYLINMVNKLGYSNTDSINHSGGYGVYFNNKLYPQLSGTPTNTNQSNIPFTFEKDYSNYADHFRLLGPYIEEQNNTKKFIYAISISRESPWFKSNDINCGNLYISFNQARNDLITNIINKLPEVKIYSASLDNYIKSDNTKNTSNTGDHIKDKSFVNIFVIKD